MRFANFTALTMTSSAAHAGGAYFPSKSKALLSTSPEAVAVSASTCPCIAHKPCISPYNFEKLHRAWYGEYPQCDELFRDEIDVDFAGAVYRSEIVTNRPISLRDGSDVILRCRRGSCSLNDLRLVISRLDLLVHSGGATTADVSTPL